MSATSPLGAVGALGIALSTVALLQRWFGAAPPARRFSTLDGLRGHRGTKHPSVYTQPTVA